MTRPKRRRSGRLRRLWLVLAIVLVAGACAVLGVHLVLRTQIPRDLVLARLQKDMGLRITAASLQTTWGGDTVLREVRVALPLADKPFLVVPRVEVSHTELPWILTGSSVRLKEVRLDRPELTICQDPAGGSNIADALAVVESSRAAQPSVNRTPLAELLPAVRIVDATVHYIHSDSRKLTIPSLNVRTRPLDGLAWNLLISIADDIEVTGALAPANDWKQALDFTVRRLDPSILAFFASPAEIVELAGRWQGRWANNALSGRMQITTLRVDQFHAVGDVVVTASAQAAVVEPDSLMVGVAGKQPIEARVESGRIRMAGSRIEIHELLARVLGGDVRVDGGLDWPIGAGHLAVAWRDVQMPAGIVHQGAFSATLQTPWPDRPHITGWLHTLGAAPQGKWVASADISGDGRSLSHVDWRVAFRELAWIGESIDIDLKGLAASLETGDDVVRLADMRLPDADRLTASGLCDMTSGRWSLSAVANGIPVARLREPADFAIEAAGSPGQIDVSEFQVKADDLQVRGQASYVSGRQMPLQATLNLSRQDDPDPSVAGRYSTGPLAGQATASGTLQPFRLSLSGWLSGRQVSLGSQRMGDVRAQVKGEIDERQLTLRSNQMQLLGGRVSLAADYHFEDAAATIGIQMAGVPLAVADNLVQPPPGMLGALDAQVNVDWPRFHEKSRNVQGEFSIRGFRKEAFAAEQITGRLAMRGEQLLIDDVKLRQKDGAATAAVRMNLQDRSRVHIEGKASDWPIELPQQKLSVNLGGETSLDINTAGLSATGDLRLQGRANLDGKPLGELDLRSTLDGRNLKVAGLTGRVLGGSFAGHGHVLVDDWASSTGQLEWKGIEAAQIASLFPAARSLAGTLDGAVRVQRNTSRGSTEPMGVDIRIQPRSATWSALPIGPAHATVHIGSAAPAKAGEVALPGRVVLEKATMHAAEGRVNAWGRVTRHGDDYHAHVFLDFDALNLDHLVHAVEAGAEPMPGRLAGKVIAFGPLANPRLMSGQGDLRLTESNLVNSDIVGGMVAAMTGKARSSQGSGAASLRIEAGALHVLRAVYNSNGLEIRMTGQVADVFQGADSGIRGYAVGTARPLRDLKLPFMADADAIFSALQGSATTMRIDGTVRDPALQPAAFSDLATSIRRLLVGDVANVEEGSGQ